MRKMRVIWYWLELFYPSSLCVVITRRPILFGFVQIMLSTGSSFWKSIQLNSLGTCLKRVCQELHLNICVRRLWVGKFSQIDRIYPWDGVLRLSFWWGIIRHLFGIFLSSGWVWTHSIYHFDIFRLLGSGWFQASYRKFYIRKNYWIIPLFVMKIIYYTASRVFLCLVNL